MATAPSHAKTLEEFERESAQNRAALAATIDDLRATVLDEVTDFRQKISLQHLTSEVTDYARDTGGAWYAKIQANARANPLRSLAIGAGLALPLASVARRIPIPVMLIGAGIALTRPSVRSVADQAGDHLGRAQSRLGDLADAAAGTAGELRANVSSSLSSVSGSVNTTADTGAASAADSLESVTDAGASLRSQIVDGGASLVRSGSDTISDTGAAAVRAASQAQAKASDIFHSNPFLVAGAGLAIGVLLAAIIPSTDAESHLLEKTAPDLKRKASDLIDEGYELASTAVGKAVDQTVGRAKEHGLSVEGAQGAADSVGDKLGAVLDTVIGKHDQGPGETGGGVGESPKRQQF